MLTERSWERLRQKGEPLVETSGADRQLPIGDEIFLDHIGHFVRDAERASAALVRAGFAPTPVSVQYNPDGTPIGTANVTVMFHRGYIEVLFKTADTAATREFDAALAERSGVHLAAFSVADAARAHLNLIGESFEMRPLGPFRRPVDTVKGPDFAAFTVVRLERGAMAEGRIQMLQHHTEHTVWQPRWLSHPNGAMALLDMVVVASDVAEAASRFSRFADRPSMPTRFGRVVRLDRGQVQIVTGAAFAGWVPDLSLPALPLIGAYALQVRSLDGAEAILRDANLPARRHGRALVVPFPGELGLGAWILVENSADLPWRA